MNALSVYWRCVSGVRVKNDGHLLTLSNGSLAIVDVRTSDTGNYTCRAENRHGADEIVVSLVIQGTVSDDLVHSAFFADCLLRKQSSSALGASTSGVREARRPVFAKGIT